MDHDKDLFMIKHCPHGGLALTAERHHRRWASTSRTVAGVARVRVGKKMNCAVCIDGPLIANEVIALRHPARSDGDVASQTETVR